MVYWHLDLYTEYLSYQVSFKYIGNFSCNWHVNTCTLHLMIKELQYVVGILKVDMQFGSRTEDTAWHNINDICVD